jgi:hypothetical protein
MARRGVQGREEIIEEASVAVEDVTSDEPLGLGAGGYGASWIRFSKSNLYSR